MSNSVDNRVVSMEFDNAKFERNVAQSLETLKHLDKSLDGLTQSSKKFDGVSFEDVANAVDSLASRFTLMGRITQRVFDEIADGIVNLGKKLINFNLDQVNSGWQKYADKTTSVQTIMSATGRDIEYVSEQLERLNRFTDETSYSFTDMTSNIAKFTSQGIDLEQAVTSMEGIATWAASAGQNAQSASRAMYNISQAMGAGSMKLLDWRSIQNANMATKEFKEQAMKAAVEVKSLLQEGDKYFVALADGTKGAEVSIKNFDQTLQHGWFTSAAMTKVFTEYGKFANKVDDVSESTGVTVSKLLQLAEAQKTVGSTFEEDLSEAADNAEIDIEDLRKAITELNATEYEFSMKTYRAAQEAKTFGDALDATKDAVSTSWMNVFETIFGNYEKARVLWTDMANWFYDLFAEPVNSLQEFLSDVLDGTDEEEKAARSLQDAMDATGVSLLDFGDSAISALKSHGLLTDEMIEEAGSVEAALANVTGSAEDFQSLIDDILASNVSSAKDASEALEDYKRVALEVLRGDWGGGSERRNALKEAGFDPDTIQLMADKISWGLGVVEGDMWRVQLRAEGFSEAEIEALEKLRSAFDETGESVETLDDKLSKMSGRDLLFSKDKETRGAIYNIMDAITELGNVAAEAWGSVFDSDHVQKAKDLLVAFNKLTKGFLEHIKTSNKLSRILKGLFAIFDIGKRAIDAIVGGIRRLFGGTKDLTGGFTEVIAKIADWIVKVDNAIKENDTFRKGVDKLFELLSKVKDKLAPIGTALSKAFEEGKKALQPLVDTIKKWWKELESNGTLEKVGDTIRSGLGSAIGFVVTVIERAVGLFPKLTEVVSNFLSANLPAYMFSIRSALGKIGMEKTVGTMSEISKGIKDFIKIFTTFLKTRDFEAFIAAIQDRFSGLIEKVKAFGQTVIDTFKGLDTNKIAAVSSLLSGILVFLGILEAVKRFTTIRTAIVTLLGSITGAIKAFTYNMKFNYIIKIAAAITILAAALIALSMIPIDRLKEATKSLGWIMGFVAAMTLLIGVFSNLPGGARMATIGMSVAAFSAGILLIVGGLMLLKQISYTEFRESMIKLVEIMMMLTIIALALSRADVAISGSSLGMIAFAVSVLLIVKALKTLEENASQLSIAGFLTLIEICAVVAIMSAAMRGVKVTSALGLLIFAYSLVAIEKALLKAMENAIPFEQFKAYWKEFLAVLGMLAAVSLVSRLSGNGSIKAILMIAAMIGVLYFTIELVNRFSKFTAEELIKGIGSIAIVCGSLAGVLWAAGKLSGASKSTTTSIVALIIGVAVVLIAMIILSAMATENLGAILAGAGAVVAVIASLAGLMAAAGYASSFKSPNVAPVFAAIIALAAVVGAAILLSKVIGPDSSGLVDTCISVAILLAALSVAMVVLSKADFNGFDSTSATQMMVKMVASLIPAIAALWVLQQLNIQASIGTVTALCMIILALSAAALLLSKADFGWKEALANGAMVALLAASLILVAVALKQLEGVQVEGLIEKAGALALLIGALGAVALALSKIPKEASFVGMLKGLGVILLAIVGLTVIFVLAAAACAELEDAGWQLEKGATILGGALGMFVGAFVGGVIEGATGVMASLGNFAKSLKPVVDQFKRFDENSVRGVEGLAKLLLALAAAELANAIDNIFGPAGGWLKKVTGTDVTGQLRSFAQAVIGYVQAMSGTSAADINKTVKITEAVAKLLDAIPKEGGIFEVFTGSESHAMKKLGENLGAFGEALASFGQSAAKITPETVKNIENAVPAAEAITKIYEALPKTGGWLDTFQGSVDFGTTGGDEAAAKKVTFFDALPGLVESIITVSDKFKNLTSDRVSALTKGAEAFGQIKVMAQALTPFKTGGWLQTATGEIDFSALSGYVTSLGDISEDIGKVAEKTKGLDESKISSLNNGVTAFESIRSVAIALDGVTKVYDPEIVKAFDVEPLADFFTNLVTLANTLSAIKEEQLTSLQNGVTAANAIRDIVTAISGEQADPSFLTISSESIQKFVTAINDFASGMAELDTEGLQDKAKQVGEALTAIAVGNLEEGKETAKTSGAAIAQSFFDGMTESMSSTEAGGAKSLLDGVTASFDGISDQLKAVGTKAVDNIVSGVTAAVNEGRIKDAGASIITSLHSGIIEAGEIEGEQNKQTLTFGKRAADSFIKGVKEKSNKIKEAGKGMMTALLDGITAAESGPESEGGTSETGGSIAEQIANSFAEAIDPATMETAAQNIAAAISEAFASADITSSISASGKAIGESLGTGITEAQDTVTESAKTVSSTAASTAETGTVGEWQTAGLNLGEGMATGITNALASVEAAARSLGEAGAQAIRDALGIASPSKVTTRYGEYFSIGFANGIRNMFGYVENRAGQMSSIATDALSTAAQLASDIVESDANPVITPVLDLSEVRRGAASLSSMGGFAATVSANGAYNVSDAVTARQIQNGTRLPQTAVLSDSAVRALAAGNRTPNKTVIEFTGDLAQLARILHPVIVDEYNYHGDSLVK